MTPDPLQLGDRVRITAKGQLAILVFIPGKLTNPQASGSRGHWSKHATTARRQREKAQAYLLQARAAERWGAAAKVPKVVTFTAHVYSEFDDDNLRTALKPTRDALKDMQVIDDDRPSAGHEFVYEQVVSRGKDARRGVEIRVELQVDAFATARGR